MNIQDALFLSFKDLKEKKIRTALTVIMVIIGVASIVALISLTAGIGASITKELSALGPTSIIISSANSGIGFTAATADQIQSLPNVSQVIPMLTGTADLRSGSENTTATIIGISPQDLQLFLGTLNFYQGSLYQDTVSPESIIGYDLAFPSTGGGVQSVIVGQPVSITPVAGKSSASITVPVVGILQPYGASIISVDSAVIMSLSAAETILHKTSYTTILVKATNTSTVSGVANSITAIYGSNARVITTQQLTQTANQIVGSISTLLVLIAGISLLVAAIGIMNIMLISVYERIHDIGVMKSLGFKNRNIMTIFIIQALIIGVFGGVIGLAAGAAGAYALTALISHSSSSTSTAAPSQSSNFAAGGRGSFGGGGFSGGSTSASSSNLSFSPVISLQVIFVAMFVAIIVSLIAGAYPAWKASRLEPVDALRELY
jgi:ABC-type antimicrobial peptide transport system permease subunit